MQLFFHDLWLTQFGGGGGQYSLAALLKETLDVALDGVLYVKFGPRDVLSWPPLENRLTDGGKVVSTR
jgi:hypothetical protein